MFGLTRRPGPDCTTRCFKRIADHKHNFALTLALLGWAAVSSGLFFPSPAAAMEKEGERLFLKSEAPAQRSAPVATQKSPRQPGWGITAKRSLMAMVNDGTTSLPRAPRLRLEEAEALNDPIMGRRSAGSGSDAFKNLLRQALKKGGKHAGRGALAIAGKAAGTIPSLRWLGKKHRVLGITIDPLLPQMRIKNDGTLGEETDLSRKETNPAAKGDEKKKKRFWNADLHWSPLKPTRFALELEPTKNVDLRPRINLSEQTLDLSFSHRKWGLSGEVATADDGVESLGAHYRLTQHTDVGVGLHGLAEGGDPQSRIEVRFSKPF